MRKNDLIGAVDEDQLGVPIHASIDGTVAEVNDKQIVIRNG